MQLFTWRRVSRKFTASLVLGVALTGSVGFAEDLSKTLDEVRGQVEELREELRQVHAEAARSRAELSELRKELAAARVEMVSARGASGGPVAQAHGDEAVATQENRPNQSDNLDARVAKLEEDHNLLAAKVDDQYQTKVESGSKYRVRLSGLMLLNVFGNRGSVDNIDVPGLAVPRGPLDSGGSFGATVRQTQLGLEVFGPKLGNARTSGDIQMDFFGGFPQTYDGVTAGIVRIRTATARFDWAKTSLVVGQDAPFISPLSPTSLASLGTPALSYAGNLWTWTPQVRIERGIDFSDTSSMKIQAGILDPLSGEFPSFQSYRTPDAGEKSRQPAYATRLSWSRGPTDRQLTVGVGSYYSRQNWGFDRHVDAWAATADWLIPFNRWLSLSGEFYRGRALGGLGGGIGRSVVQSGPLSDPATVVNGLDSVGGWGQIKVAPNLKLEFNGAFGQDNPFAEDLRYAGGSAVYGLFYARNRSAIANVIYRPRSNLLFSVEYRRLLSFEAPGGSNAGDHINLAMGVLF